MDHDIKSKRPDRHHRQSVEVSAFVVGWLRKGALPAVLLVIGQGAALLSLMLISKRADPADFGRLSSGLALQNYLILLGSLGLRTLVVRDLARSPDRLPQIWGTYWILIAPVGGAVAMIGHFGFVWLSGHDPGEATMSAWLAVGGWFSMLTVTPLLDGLKRQRAAMGIVAATEFLLLMCLWTQVISVSPADLGLAFGLKWIVCGVLQSIILWRTAQPECLRAERGLWRLWRKSIPALMATTLIVNLPMAASVLIARYAFGEYEAAAIGLGAQLSAAVMLLGGMVVRFIEPVWRSVTDLRSSRATRVAWIVFLGGIGVWISIAGAVTWLGWHWLPDEYREGLASIHLLLLYGVLSFFARVLWIALIAANQERVLLAGYGSGCVAFAASAFCLIDLLGPLGISVAAVFGSLTTIILLAGSVRSVVRG